MDQTLILANALSNSNGTLKLKIVSFLVMDFSMLVEMLMENLANAKQTAYIQLGVSHVLSNVV